MPDRVEVAACGAHGSGVDVGVQDGLLVPCRSRQDGTLGVDDDAVAGLNPVVLLGAPDPVAMREVGRDLVEVHAGIDADDVATALARDVPHGRDPAVPRSEGGCRPDIHSLAVDVEPGQRHVVLPAGQPGQPPVRSVDDWQRGAVAHAPHGAF